MAKLSQRAEVTTEVEVELAPKLKTKVKQKLDALARMIDERKALEAKIAAGKEELETIFHDAGESEAIENGVKVGDITLKVIKGTSRRLDVTRLMKAYRITPSELEKYKPETENKPYFGIFGGVFGGKKGKDE